MFSLSFFSKKNNPKKPSLLEQEQDRLEDLFPQAEDITVLDPQEMMRVEGGKSNAQLYKELRKLGSSCGDTIPQ